MGRTLVIGRPLGTRMRAKEEAEVGENAGSWKRVYQGRVKREHKC
jgi:hypothetical protein